MSKKTPTPSISKAQYENDKNLKVLEKTLESQEEKFLELEEKLKVQQRKLSEVELKDQNFRDKITKHRETLHRLFAENESLLEEIRRVRTERDDKKSILSNLNMELEMLNESVSDRQENKQGKSNVKLVCSICEDKISDHVFAECGHLFCETCSKRVNDSFTECPICRKPKPDLGFKIIKLFL